MIENIKKIHTNVFNLHTYNYILCSDINYIKCRLAIGRSDVNQYGRPEIVVIAYGASNTSSYKTNYIALSNILHTIYCYI